MSTSAAETYTYAYGKQLSFASMLIPDSLSGTRSSANWAKPPGGMDRLNTRAVFPSENEWEIPCLPRADARPTALAAYSDRREIQNAKPGAAVHFFLDDYRFETIWTHPIRGLDRCAKIGIALTPDFSMWRDMPLVMQLWQVYRSRWCGAWLLHNGIDVIPTVSWSTPETFKFAFAGIASGSVVAISTVGVGDRAAQLLFRAGCEELAECVSPSCVLIYGRELPAAERAFANSEVRHYPARWAYGR